MKKLFTILLSICILLSLTGCNKKVDTTNIEIKESKYLTVWDDEAVYKTEEDFKKDVDKLDAWINEIGKYQGKLNTVDGLLGYIETTYDIEYTKLYDKLNSYATYGTNLYPNNQKFYNCSLMFNDLTNRINEALSYFDEEMASIPYADRIALFYNEKIVKYINLYTAYLYEDISTNKEVTNTTNTLTSSYGRMRLLYKTLVNYGIPDIEYKLKSGEVINVNDANLNSILARDLDEETKLAIFDAWWKNIKNYSDSLTYILETELMEEANSAKLSGINSTRVLHNFIMGYNEDVIQKIIDYAKKNNELNIRYYSLYANPNGEYYTFSRFNQLNKYESKNIFYDDGVDEVISALSVLGDEYVSAIKEIANSGHVDAFPSEGKASGAFEIGNFVGQDPYLMFNYQGDVTSVADIAHEMGHACYDKLSNDNQEIYYWGTATFTQEVASITNELLYYMYKLDNATSEQEELMYLENLANRWSSDLYNGTYWQEFENYCHDIVDQGGHLVSEDLAAKWEELAKVYYGENINLGEYGKYRYATLPSLYNNYYEYTYATSMVYASVLAHNIYENVPNAKENYLAFLKSGASLSSVDALKLAGIDIYDEKVYETAFSYFDEIVTKIENLCKK